MTIKKNVILIGICRILSGMIGGKEYENESAYIRCPNCGRVINSFTRNCTACGFELRNIGTSSAVREFTLKLENLEKRRCESPNGLSFFYNNIFISRTDEQEISLIPNYSIPNTKEDMLEFIILATSNINYESFDSTNTKITKSEKALAEAWRSKIKQVYEKARMSYGDAEDFERIQNLYDESNKKVRKSKRCGVIKWCMLFGWVPMLFIVAFIVLGLKALAAEKKEVARMETIYNEAQTALVDKEYETALLNAESLVYSPNIHNENTAELKRKWDVKRKVLIDEILSEAERAGIKLEYTPTNDSSGENSTEKN